jgi:hypothetical protein
MANELGPSSPGEFLIYQTEDGQTRVQVRLDRDTAWLSLNQMADLFQRDKSVISRHIANVFQEGELRRDSVVAEFATTAADGKTYQVDYYNLDVIISVGYRVQSLRGTQFRIWATQRLREYIVKGFTMDDERLKQAGGGNYFDELIDRIRDIRSSERVFWRKVLDIYATSIDYDKNADSSKLFFQTVQNKMHLGYRRPDGGRNCSRPRIGGPQSDRVGVPRLCGTPGPHAQADVHCRLDSQAGRLHPHRRPRDSHPRGQDIPRGGQAQGGSGIRDVPHRPGRVAATRGPALRRRD